MGTIDPDLVRFAALESERVLFGDGGKAGERARKCLMVCPVGDEPMRLGGDVVWERIESEAAWRDYLHRRHRIEAPTGSTLAETASLVAGMRAVQAHLPLHWYFLRHAGEPVAAAGVLPIDVAGRRFHRLQDVDVFPPDRGRGFGNVLLDLVHAHAVECAASAVLLGADIDDWPIGWYRRRGYSAVATVVKKDCGRTEFGPPEFEKACACVVSDNQLLVFRHPSAGFQIPKGSLEGDENPVTGVLRELEEEAGIGDGRVEAALAPFLRLVASGLEERGPMARHRWHVFVIRVDRPLPRRWDHTATGSEEEAGLVFRYSWHDLISGRPRPPEFAPIFIEVIDRVRRHLRLP